MAVMVFGSPGADVVVVYNAVLRVTIELQQCHVEGCEQ